ncbi:hypothetical protein CYCD_19610 [Tenuifilaceae bacterium CYCD]|nr:hypothetical protein CYCD_19610 [Tenuifilaceae bacterium CYCD]
MKNITIRIGLMLVIALALLASCKEADKNTAAPIVELISGEGLITDDTSASVAEILKFKVHCNWNGDNTLTNFIVASNDKRVVDEGMNVKEFEREVTFAKGTDDVELIVFTIRDIKGGSSSVSLTVNKDDGTIGGELVRFNSIELDAQSVENGKSFLSLTNGVSYTMQDAYGIQGDIHMLYFYDANSDDLNTIASPGANLTGILDLSSWTTRNTARFYQVTMTQEQFDTVSDPAYVVSLYSEADGKRKAKNLKAGDIYSFKLESNGKYGILRVTEVTGQADGKIVFSVVMQK